MIYQIWGDFGKPTQTLLEEFNWLEEARAWFRGYTRYDLGGYDFIYLMDKQENIYQAIYANDEEMV